ncbi:transglycosylase SLT domain-containing protein [Weissella confusa]|uniref:transglycosylase SLT domain-containing protein n=1 Tax=Weissella confusa TaxID=1583 RepID=UPI00376EAC20
MTSDVFVKAMDELGVKYKDGQAEAMTSFQGMTMYLGKRKAQLFGEIEQSSFNMSKKMKSDLLDITSDKSMEKYAQAISKAMGKVMAVVEKMIEYIRAHKKDIMEMFSNVANITGILGGAIWNTIKGTILGVAKAIGSIGGNAKKSHDPLKTVNSALEAILRHKGAIKALGATIATAFMAKKMIDFGKGVHSTISDINGMRQALVRLATSEKAATGAQKALTMAQKAFNFVVKNSPIGRVVLIITALIGAFYELYKHNKKFRQFVNGLVKSAKQFFEGITKWFGNAWSSVTKGYNSFSRSFSKGWHSFTDGIGKAWNNTWSYVSNVFDKYINIYKRVIKTFTDFFTGNWGNLGKDIRGIWNALWDYVESIFGKKVGSIKSGIEGFGSKIWSTFQTIKDKVSGFWSDMWNGLKDFARDGINNVISVINNGIGGINSVIHTFGGKKEAIGKIPKFANGTKGAPKGLAIVNDAPGEHYKEAIIDNSGKATVLEGRNRLVNFSGGETVIPAHALPHFADGTDGWLDTAVGWIKDKWDKLTEFISHPIKSLGNIMNKAVENISGSALVTNVAPAMGNGFVQGISEPIVNLFKSLKKKHDDEGQQAPAGSGVQRWKDQVVSALKANGLSTSDGMVNKVLRQIATESGGNEKAVQGGYTDINTITGDLAKGLMQTISATFNAYKFPGHGNIFNGYDNLLAALNYAKHRYGSDLSFLGQGHGYENGGIVSTHGLYEVAERNMPEIIIPLDPAKKMRANDLLEQANARINGNRNSGQAQIVQEGDTYQIEINVNADLTPNTLKKLQQEFEDTITRKQNAKSRAFG